MSATLITGSTTQDMRQPTEGKAKDRDFKSVSKPKTKGSQRNCVCGKPRKIWARDALTKN
jgi:hypothetical protein